MTGSYNTNRSVNANIRWINCFWNTAMPRPRDFCGSSKLHICSVYFCSGSSSSSHSSPYGSYRVELYVPAPNLSGFGERLSDRSMSSWCAGNCSLYESLLYRTSSTGFGGWCPHLGFTDALPRLSTLLKSRTARKGKI